MDRKTLRDSEVDRYLLDSGSESDVGSDSNESIDEIITKPKDHYFTFDDLFVPSPPPGDECKDDEDEIVFPLDNEVSEGNFSVYPIPSPSQNVQEYPKTVECPEPIEFSVEARNSPTPMEVESTPMPDPSLVVRPSTSSNNMNTQKNVKKRKKPTNKAVNPPKGKGRGRPKSKNTNKEKATKKKSKPKKFVDSDWPWLDQPNEPKQIRFCGVPGVNSHTLRRLGNNPNELDCFDEFLGNEFWETICTETNDYARKLLNDPERKKLKSDDKWRDVTIHEMKAYFALYINMGQVKKPDLKKYWTHRKIIETKIYSETMSFERFTSISRFLHFHDEEFEASDGSDKLIKIRPIIRYLETKFLHTVEPEQNLALDETLLKLRARLRIIQFNPMKRARFGVKIYKVCESSSGYCFVFKIYVGDDKKDDLLASESVVLDLMEPFFGVGHTVYLDNWYSSPRLYTKLIEKDLHAVGTAVIDRKCMPQVFKETKLEVGEAIKRSGRGVLAIKWLDRKNVYMLSTMHEDIEMKVSKVVKIGEKQVEVRKPRCVIEYNKGMLGVDRQDQVLSCFPIMRRSVKAYKKIFFYLIDMTIYNAFVVFKKVRKIKKMRFTDFRLNLVEQILESVTLPARATPGRAPLAPSPLRLQAKQWAHFPKQIPPTACKKFPARACKVCTSHKIRAETRWLCEQCDVPLHLENCFKTFHTQLQY